MARNRYPGNCGCGARVAKGKGYFERRNGVWVVRCMKCVVAGKQAKDKPLSGAQSDWLRNWEAENG